MLRSRRRSWTRAEEPHGRRGRVGSESRRFGRHRRGFPVTSTERERAPAEALHRIVVVGGGAGGLELATRLGDKLGKRKQGARHADRKGAHAFLEAAPARDRRRQHGPRRLRDQLPRAVALAPLPLPDRRNGRPRPRAARGARSAPFVDEDGDQVDAAARVRLRHAGHRGRQPDQRLRHAGRRRSMRSRSRRADRRSAFHRRLVNAYIRAHAQAEPLRAGAAATSRSSAPARPASSSRPSCTTRRARWCRTASTASIRTSDIQLILIEAADRILPALPARLSDAATELLAKLDVQRAHVGARRRGRCRTACGSRPAKSIPAGARRLGRRRQGARFPARTSTASRPIASISSSCCRRCRRRATRTSSRSAIAPRARGSARKARRCRRARSPRTSRRRTWSKQIATPPARQAAAPTGATATSARWSRSASTPTVGNLMGGLSGSNLWIEGWFARMMYLSLVQDARARVARLLEGHARHRGEDDHAAHRAACEAALSPCVAPAAIVDVAPGHDMKGEHHERQPHRQRDPAQLLANLFEKAGGR